MSLEDRKYLALITFKDDSQTWKWLKSKTVDSAQLEVRDIFFGGNKEYKAYNKKVVNVQFVCADRWSVDHVDKTTAMHYGRTRHIIMAYDDGDCEGGDSESIVPYGLVPVNQLVYLPRASDYGIMLNTNFQLSFDRDGKLSASLGIDDNEIGYEHYGNIMNMDWWFEEAERKVRQIQEDRDDFDIMTSPDGRSCYIIWADDDK